MDKNKVARFLAHPVVYTVYFVTCCQLRMTLICWQAATSAAALVHFSFFFIWHLWCTGWAKMAPFFCTPHNFTKY